MKFFVRCYDYKGAYHLRSSKYRLTASEKVTMRKAPSTMMPQAAFRKTRSLVKHSDVDSH